MKVKTKQIPHIIKSAFSGVEKRKSTWDLLKRYYYQGGENPAYINKIYAYVDTLSSFLFSAETTTFSFITHENFSKQFNQALPLLRKVLLTEWQDINGDVIFDYALHQAIVYGVYFIKVVFIKDVGIRLFAIHPKDIGCANVNLPNIVDQEFIIHRYYIAKPEMRRILQVLNKEHLFNKISFTTKSGNEDLGAIYRIVNASMTYGGEVVASNDIDYMQFIDEEPTDDVAECYECWIYDDELKDYRVITYNEDVGILFDRPNPFIKRELPFIAINLNPLSFYGFSDVLPLLKLQDWASERIDQLRQLMVKQLFPSLAITGSTFSANDEELLNFYKTEGFLTISDPSAKITPLTQPVNLQSIFAELQEIDKIFYEMSGIRDILLGGVSSAVRTAEQTQVLSLLASSRVKKKALLLQTILEKLIYIFFKTILTYEDIKIPGYEMPALVIPIDELSIKVDAHSLSPIFAQEFKQDLFLLFKAGIVGGDDVLELLNFPMAEYLIQKLQARQQMMMMEQMVGGKKK